jgi:hypothetical protein
MNPDLRFENIGFKIPGIDQYSEDQILEWMGYPEMIPIVPRDHLAQRDSLPNYLIKNISVGESDMDDPNMRFFAQIMGFGTGLSCALRSLCQLIISNSSILGG